MSTELIINASLPETRIALMENGEIQDLLIERASGKGIVGNIYKGRVTRVLPGMQAAFVDIGLEKAAFLYVDDVFVHSEIWEAEEVETEATAATNGSSENSGPTITPVSRTAGEAAAADVGALESQPRESGRSASGAEGSAANPLKVDDAEAAQWESELRSRQDPARGEGEEDEDSEEGPEDGEGAHHNPGHDVDGHDDQGDSEDDDQIDSDEEDEDDQGPVGMGPPPGGEGDGHDESGGSSSGHDDSNPSAGTVGPSDSDAGPSDGGEGGPQTPADQAAGDSSEIGPDGRRRRHRRGRRGGRFRRKDRTDADVASEGSAPVIAANKTAGSSDAEGVGQGQGHSPAHNPAHNDDMGDSFQDPVSESGEGYSDRSALSEQSHAGQQANAPVSDEPGQIGRPDVQAGGNDPAERPQVGGGKRPEFKEPRSRDRRIRSKQASKPVRAQANIQDLLKEGQEVIVQVAKDPISTKGARLTCHISLPGRHLVCMPTIDHVGVSRRIERDDERRKLREYVERYRPKNLGFIVRTASGKNQSEKRIKQDIEYLTRLWAEIRERAGQVTAPALVYEDLNSVLRAIRDWVTEDIDKIVVDSRYHFNDIQRFASHFMPSLKQKVELYHGDVPIFDAYNISTELARGLERKVWLKSGGYLVVDQAEALVAIDVNTGRFVGKKNLEDTILKTNLEAVQEIAYQLRLRNCGGIIILDLIDMEREENKQRVYRALEEALKKDRARPSILKISELGLVEMTRKRTRDTMVRALCEACTQCEGKGFIKSKQTVAYEILRELERVGIERDIAKVLVQANPDVIDILAIEERDTLDQLERRYRKQVFLQAVLDYHMERFEVTADKREKGDRGIEVSSDGGSRRGREGQGDRERNDRDRGGRNRNRGRDRDRGSNNNSRDSGGGRDRVPQVRPVTGSSVMIEPVSHTSAEGITPNAAGDFDLNGGASGATLPTPRQTGQDDFYSEEDRLAFVRAQATQDAALARLNAGGGQPQAPQPRGGRDRQDRGGGGRDRHDRNRNQGGGGGHAANPTGGQAGQDAGGDLDGGGMGLGRAPVEGRGGDRADRDAGRRGRRGRRGGKHRRGREDQPRPVGTPGPGIITPRSAGGGSSNSTGGSSSGSGGGESGGNGDGSGSAPASGGGGGDHSNPPTT